MSIAKVLSLEIEQLATNNIQLFWIDESTNLPVDVTDYSALLEVKKGAGDLVPVLTLSTDNGRITLGGVTGAINITVQPADTDFITVPNPLPWEFGYYSLYLTNTIDGSVAVFSTGMITLLLKV